MHLNVQCLLYSLGSTSIGHARHVKHGTLTVSGYFHKNCRFLWGKNVSKTNLESTIHYAYTSYNKYFRLCMVSEELRLNEIGLFLQQYRNLNPIPQRMLRTNLVEISPVVLVKKLLIIVNVFHYFVIISPWKKRGFSFEQT